MRFCPVFKARPRITLCLDKANGMNDVLYKSGFEVRTCGIVGYSQTGNLACQGFQNLSFPVQDEGSTGFYSCSRSLGVL